MCVMVGDILDNKKFLTYEQQIKKLLDKKLEINNPEEALKLLKKYSYFNLINGYKAPFKGNDGNYKKGTSIRDIYSLFTFDDELRHILMKYILIVELNVKSLLSYSFCEKFGEEQNEYQNALNYNYTPNNQKAINDLIQHLVLQMTNAQQKVSYVEHQATKHHNIPLWVLVKTLSFGQISKMYSLQQDSIKSKITKEMPRVRENQLSIMLDILSRYRNVCAHNERLFDFKYKRSRLKTTTIHKHFNLYTDSPSPSNLFDVMIFLKLLLTKNEFLSFAKEFEDKLQTLSKATNQIQKSLLLRLMGFPQNWKEIIDL